MNQIDKTNQNKSRKGKGQKVSRHTHSLPTNSQKKLNNSFLLCENQLPTEDELKRRKQRFAGSELHESKQNHFKRQVDPTKPIVGRCTVLEKSYFRLTSVPDPEAVRPEEVLKKAYKRLKKMWKEGSSSTYLLDQLKAIRQDLVVQHISNRLTVKVYELNAKIAIFANDMNELNQCQSMLCSLYKTIPSKHQMSFLSTNLLYDIIHNNTIDIHRHVQLAQSSLTDTAIQHSLLVLHAVRTHDYLYYLQLIQTASKESRHLMEYYLPRFRHAFIKMTLMTAFPSISVAQLSQLTQLSEDELKAELAKSDIQVDTQIDIVKNKLSIAQF